MRGAPNVPSWGMLRPDRLTKEVNMAVWSVTRLRGVPASALRFGFVLTLFVATSCVAPFAKNGMSPMSSTWFRSVEPVRGSIETFCGIEGAESSGIVVAVYPDVEVQTATFVVQPVANDQKVTGETPAIRDGVYLERGTASCIRVPLPASRKTVFAYNVTVSGQAGSKHVNGGEIECQPKLIQNWDCVVR